VNGLVNEPMSKTDCGLIGVPRSRSAGPYARATGSEPGVWVQTVPPQP
jgi:hypothetical protein